MRTRSLRNLIYLAAGLGILLSLFAAFEVIDAALTSLCSFSGFVSCAAVANSGRTTTLGVPDWAWGIAGFVAILIVASLAERHPSDRRYPIGLVVLTGAGTALSFYFAYVELALIGAVCIVCFSSYVMGWLCFGGSIALAQRGPDAVADDDPA